MSRLLQGWLARGVAAGACTLAVAGGWVGCSGEPPAPAAGEPPDASLGVSQADPGPGPGALAQPGPAPSLGAGGLAAVPDFDLTAIVRRAHFAYRPNAFGGYESGHTDYGVELTASGALRFTPATAHPESTPAQPRAILGAPIELASSAVARGARPLSLVAPRATVDADGSLWLARGAMVEHLRSEEGGVEQSFHFERRPEGPGDLVVTLAVSGLAYLGESPQGLHFEDPETGLGVRYGLGTWIDGTGARSGLTPRWDEAEGVIELTVPASVVEASAYPAVLDPLISPEFGMNSPPVSVVAAAMQVAPQVASDGTNWAVVWTDYRAVTEADIYGTMVSGAGAVLAPTGMPLVALAGQQTDPCIAYGNGNYMLGYTEAATGGTNVYGQRFDAAGAAVGGRISVATAAGGQRDCDVAYTASNTRFLFVWGDDASGGDVYGARVTSTGGVLDATPLPISASTTYADYGARVDGDGTNWGVSFISNGTKFRTVSNAGVLGTTSSLWAGGSFQPDVAYSSAASAYLVAWVYFNGTSHFIHGMRLNTSGTPLDVTALVLVPGITTPLGQPAVAGSASGWMLAWNDARNASATGTDLRGQLLSATAGLSGAQFIVSAAAGGQSEPAVALGPSAYLVAWTDARNPATASDIYGARVTTAGTVSDTSGLAISTSGNSQQQVAVASAGINNFLVAWQDVTAISNGWDIWAVNVDGLGSVLNPAGLAIASTTGDQARPAVASNGTDYVVVYEDYYNGANYDISGRRVSTAGATLGAAVTVAGTNAHERNPDVAYSVGGGAYLVVWEQLDTVMAQGFTAGFVPSAGAFQVGNNCDTLCVHPRVAANAAGGYLAVWENFLESCYYGCTYSWNIRAVSMGAAMGTTVSITSDGISQAPDVTSDGAGYLIGWHDTNGNVRAAVTTSAGAVLASRTLSDATGTQSQVAVGWDGCQYVATWADGRDVLGFDNDTQSDIYANWLTPAGVVLDGTGVLVQTAATPEVEQMPALVADGTGRVLMGYSRVDGASTMRSLRARGRFISRGKVLGQACATNAECNCGNCVDGVCCESACAGGTTDCQRCNVPGSLGRCVLSPANDVCNPSTGVCDPAESCTGSSVACPAAAFSPPGTTCTDDGQPCTVDVCDAAGGCTHNPGNAGQVCRAAAGVCDQAETCNGTSPTCPTNTYAAPGTACATDNQFCTADVCDGSGACAHPPTNEGQICRVTAGVCDVPETCTAGVCPTDSYRANGASCSDGDVCNGAESCSGGVCQPGQVLRCDDGKVCTTDTCDSTAGCVNTDVANGTTCDDNNPCTTSSSCSAGSCVGVGGPNCDDNNPCTADGCDVGTGQCTHPNVTNGTACSDGSACTQTDACQAGVCVGSAPISCDDGNPCTADTCDAQTGCQASPLANGASCTDSNPCNGAETCQAGACAAGTAPSCDDGNPCTADGCLAGSGCFHTNVANGSSCSDGLLCNGSETCTAGACQPGAPLACSDGNPCTADTCDDGAGGCVFAAVGNGTSCADANLCNGAESCLAGQCVAGTALLCNDNNPCTTDACSPATGCTTAPATDGTGCTDGNACTQGDSCQAGACAGGATLNCGDNNPCTTDACDSATGCTNVAVADNTTCDDLNECSTGDRCLGGQCSGTGGINCDDGNPCTLDTCQVATQLCTYTNLADSTACSDGDACTVSTTCQSGLCTGGATLSCDDGEICTADTCDPAAGCRNPSDPAAACTDGDPCTVGDSCATGTCQAGTPLSCTASECRAAGSCNPATGACSGAAATDGTPCTGGQCLGGVCQPDGTGGTAGAGGAGGAAGAAGAAGSAGTAGTGGVGGNAGAGAAGGTGGTAGSTGGTAGAGTGGSGGTAGAGGGGGTGGTSAEGGPGGTSSGETFTRDPAGCACATPGQGPHRDAGRWLAALALGLAVASRRSRQRG